MPAPGGRRTVALAAVLTLVLAGCGELSTGSADFVGRTYLSTSVETDEQPVALVPGTQLSLTFGQDEVLASAGCNTFSAAGGITDGVLIVEALASTEIACSPDLMAQEEAWAALLVSEPAAQVGERALTLTSSTTSVAMESAEDIPDEPLAETVWQLDSVLEHDTASSVPAGTESTLTITGETITVAIDDCRSTQTPVAVGEAEVTVDPAAFTASPCLERAGGAAFVDRAVVAVFGEGSVPFVVDRDRLLLTGPFGWGLVYRAP